MLQPLLLTMSKKVSNLNNCKEAHIQLLCACFLRIPLFICGHLRKSTDQTKEVTPPSFRQFAKQSLRQSLLYQSDFIIEELQGTASMISDRIMSLLGEFVNEETRRAASSQRFSRSCWS